MKEHDLLEDDFTGPLTNDETTLATVAHLGAFAAFMAPGVGNILLPLVIWLVKRDESEYIDLHAKEALNFQITVTILMAASGILAVIVIGFFFMLIIGLLTMALSITAAVKANRGELYEYPINFRLIK